MKFLVKICGITNAHDAEMAAAAGADAVGLNFWPASKRFVGEDAAAILSAVPPGVLKFGVFVNATPQEVTACASRYGLDRVQLHGDESAVDFAAVPASVLVRAIRVRDAASLAGVDDWRSDLFLLDAFAEGYGGAGITAPWEQIAAARPRRSFLLAGGLTPDNVAAAIRATRPAGVDVASGVESANPRLKDPVRVTAFIRAARAAAADEDVPG